MRFLKANWPILFVLLAAAGLRFYRLSTIPIGFNDDEAAFGYNAYSILKTGRDEWGRLLPFPAFESFGDWKLVFYLYLAVISQFVFGINEFATRLPSAIFGVAAVGATYFLAKQLFDKKTAMVAALLTAISPWHIIASRNAFESDLLSFFITIGVYLLLRGLDDKKYLVFSLISFIVCFYIYRSSWVFVPLFMLSLVLIFKNQLKNLKLPVFKYLLILIVLILPLAPTVMTFSGQSRFFQESFILGVSKVGITNEINEKRGDCFKNLPALICGIFYNKFLSYITIFINNYFENLSPSTYFTKATAGGYQSYTNRGLFYSFELPFLIIGIVAILKSPNPAAKILISWILLAPIGASFTQIGNPGRLNILMPAPQIIAAYGILQALSSLKSQLFKKVFLATISAVVTISSARLILDLFANHPQIAGRAQRYGYHELFKYLESQKDKYDYIAVSRQSDDAKQYIHYLFTTKPNPEIFTDPQVSIRYRGSDRWQVVEKIGKFHFYSQTPKPSDLPPKTLLAAAGDEVLFTQAPTFVVKYLNGDVAFEVYETDKLID